MRAGYLVPVLAVFVLVGLLAYGLTRDPSKIDSALIGRVAPAFDLPRLTDPDARFSDRQLRGRVSLFNVWASWCLGCRREHALLAELSERADVPVYGLNYKDKRQDALRWLERYGNLYVVSGYDSDGRVGIDWGVAAVPETFVVDAEGVIRYKQVGEITRRDLEEKLLPLIDRLKSGARRPNSGETEYGYQPGETRR